MSHQYDFIGQHGDGKTKRKVITGTFHYYIGEVYNTKNYRQL